MELHLQNSTTQLADLALSTLKQLIEIESFSRQEDKTADLLQNTLASLGIAFERKGNNVWAKNLYFDAAKPSVLLNSHHDTVKPNKGYTLNPFEAIEKDGKLYGLGSNDAGGALVSLMAAFLYYYDKPSLNYNVIFAATAEEEVSGTGGIELIANELGEIYLGIVGEPTEMHLAIAEKGLLVLDCVSHGTASHAAHENNNNALYKALADIEWFRTYHFPEKSEILGDVKMTVTIIKAGSQHNVISDKCEFTVDIRTNDKYRNADVLAVVKQHVSSEVTARSLRLNSSAISPEHPFVKAGLALGRKIYGSPTTSDQALMNFPTVKLGPGNSLRSHSSDEFIFVDEIREGIEIYCKLLSSIL
ncbi:acetylornithine deacetylase [Flexibacter flexilis DSM 6793]|uniref:Acetylornithine deacetylase n=1 Tax=Flexibacter flexilis DSM 6793 TaxID=927664 RepID=A0A1I1F318_9BACT|nr:M20 family metallo-hydrolase [Flexibacter flexilis]SFB93332.1 acetylornithine deacetylase [Flexibacter flexilis DSM 6793]